MKITEAQALEILKKYTTKPNLIKHAIVVGAVMKHFAALAGEDQNYWAVVGLLHDVDYEMYPDEHCYKLPEILKKEGFDDKFIYSIQSHGYEICTNVEPKTYMEKVLCAVDQLSGLIIACALVRPEKKLEFVTLETIHKRWKVPTFAAGTDRERILRFCERMGKSFDGLERSDRNNLTLMPQTERFDWVAEQTLIAMKAIAEQIGL